MNVLLQGCGYWGKNILRNLLKFPNLNIFIDDVNKSEISKLLINNPRISEFNNNFNDISCAIICTPPSSHFDCARKLMEDFKISCLIQKPFVRKIEEAAILSKISQTNRLTLMAAHTFIYHPAIKYINNNLSKLGNVNSYKSIRYNLGLFNRDGNVVEDLLPHDASILYQLFGGEVDFVSATGSSKIKMGLIDTANITVIYKNGLYSNIDISWLSAIKLRQIIINGNKQTVVFDDNNLSEKLKYYDAGVDYNNELLFSYRKGDTFIPKIEESESIYNELSHFFDCVSNNRQPLTGISDAEFSIKLVSKSLESINNGGRPVKF